MRIHYVVAEFGKNERVRGPAGTGTLGGDKLKASAGMVLYRDMDVDPHTLVAEANGKVYHYAWATVQTGVVDVDRTWPKAEPEKAPAKKAS
jgi:hypothetical protein